MMEFSTLRKMNFLPFTTLFEGMATIQEEETASCKFYLLRPIFDCFAVLSPVAPIVTEHAEGFLSTFRFRCSWFGRLCVDIEGS